MHINKAILGILLIVALVAIGFWYTTDEVTAPSTPRYVATSGTPTYPPRTKLPQQLVYNDVLRISTPLEGVTIESPFVLEGEARGTWYFEASFPVILTNWDGLIIAEGIAQAQSDWMTEEYVPFKVTLTFESPYKAGDQSFMQRGSLIFKKDNPSGLPENDDAFETTVFFSQSQI